MNRTAFHTLNGLMTLLFLGAAVAQYNDPDPVLWMTVYGTAVLCCLLYSAGRLPVFIPAALSIAYTLGALYLLGRILWATGFVNRTGQEMMGVTEVGRELMGLLLAAGWTGILSRLARPQRSTSKAKPSTPRE